MNVSRINFRPILGWASVIALLSFPLFSVSGALNMFFKIGDIKGESIDKVHGGEIDVLAWSWGMSNSGTTHVAGGTGTGKASVQDLSFTKYLDRASPVLMLATLTGQTYPDALLTIARPNIKGVFYECLKLKLEEVMVTSVSTGGSGGQDKLTENVTLNFAKFELDYIPLKADGVTTDTPIPVTYDIRLNTGK